jgi:hypothetical protein
VDSINKRHNLWGFRGIKGQMFFNMLVNVADDQAELDQELKSVLVLPTSDEIAASRLRTFSSYVRRVGEQHVDAGGSKAGRPKVSSVPFFVSYYWQIIDRDNWPVFYTSSVDKTVDLNLWQPEDDIATDYINYKKLYEQLSDLFSQESGRRFSLYDVEHVFWFTDERTDQKSILPPEKKEVIPDKTTLPQGGVEFIKKLPTSFVPPIIQIIPRLACNDEALIEPAKASGTNIPRALEKSVDAAFGVLGYETKLLGQGKGRVPDGLAVENDNSYAIIWDAKARSDKYSLGTDDRTIREYIVSQSRDIKRKRRLRNIYYAIISSKFAEDYDDPIRMLKMETDISEVVLMEADALVSMVDLKLRDPLQITLGPDGFQRLLAVSSVLTAENVREMLA